MNKPVRSRDLSNEQQIERIRAVDLFCGAGGLTHGLQKAGLTVSVGVDLDPDYEYPYRANNRADFLLKSVADVSADDLEQAYGGARYKLLAGCAPCQPFSTTRLE
jgi:DNA (cytosine-5)-methyltransferase 1